MTTDAQNEAIDVPTYQRLHRTVLGACVVLAPLVILVGFATDPELGVPHKGMATIEAFRHADHSVLELFLFVNVITPYFYPLSILALGMLAMRRSPWLATVGIATGLLGALPWPIFVGQEAMAHQIATMPHSAQFVPILQGVSFHEWEVTLLYISWVPFHLLGYVILGLALKRARVIPLWAALCFILNVPLVMYSYANNAGIWQIIGTGLVLLGSIPAAYALLQRPGASMQPGGPPVSP